MIKETNNNDKGLVFIGEKDGEEYYLNLSDDNVRGWSFMGLRSETEENLRKYARESEPRNYLGISRQDFEAIEPYFDYESWADAMEEDWHERHDCQLELDRDGETMHLGFGSGTDIFRYWKENNITDFESYTKHFENVGLHKRSFDYINEIIQKRKDKDTLKMTDIEKAREKELFTSFFISQKP